MYLILVSGRNDLFFYLFTRHALVAFFTFFFSIAHCLSSSDFILVKPPPPTGCPLPESPFERVLFPFLAGSL